MTRGHSEKLPVFLNASSLILDQRTFVSVLQSQLRLEDICEYHPVSPEKKMRLGMTHKCPQSHFRMGMFINACSLCECPHTHFMLRDFLFVPSITWH